MKKEHFCTLFDSKFLPMGLCLYRSLVNHAGDFHLWVLCMDEEAEKQLRILNLPRVSLLPLKDFETPELLSVKPGRNRAEYCWTLTPFLPSFVFQKDTLVERVTYLDADLFFFQNPDLILAPFTDSEKSVLLTEHAYAPEYEQSEKSGRFCVQFMTFKKNHAGLKILRWWQERCIEWCFARHELGKFGDQKYLDQWPTLFSENIYILEDKSLAMAPWNAAHLFRKYGSAHWPVFYHFHGLRILSRSFVRLFRGYKVGNQSHKLFLSYRNELNRVQVIFSGHNFPWPVSERITTLRQSFQFLKGLVLKEITSL